MSRGGSGGLLPRKENSRSDVFRFVKMNMPEPRIVVENFGGFVIEKVKLEGVAARIVEPMSEVNKYGIEFAAVFVGLVEKFNAIDVANFESSEDCKNTFLSYTVKDMGNDYGGILRIKTELSSFFLFGSCGSDSGRSKTICSYRSLRRIHSPIDFIHANMGVWHGEARPCHGACIESTSMRNALGFLVVVVVENR